MLLTAHHALDYRAHDMLRLDYDAANGYLTVHFCAHETTGQRLVARVLELLTLAPTAGFAPTRVQQAMHVQFAPVGETFVLQLGDEPIGHYRVMGTNLTATHYRPLTVDEVRRLGTFHAATAYPQWRSELDAAENEALLTLARRSVFTDFHTHSSGHISPEGLLAVAMQHRPYYYPAALLTEAGIDLVTLPATARAMIPRIPFPPKERPGIAYPAQVEGVDLHLLAPSALAVLAAKMAMPADRQATFTEMEHDAYRFRYPMAKDRMLVRGILRRTAQELAGHGIRYAELAYVGLDQPATLALLHEVVGALPHDPTTAPLTLRFMMGIPRGFALPKIQELLEKARILTASPYVVGVDFLGYEVNKTARFVALYDQFAAWANTHRPGLTLRVHAGENDKNQDNIRAFLQMAEKYPHLHYRVGHGIYGMDETVLKLAQRINADAVQPRLTLEFNPSSNMALNNIDDLRDIPFRHAVAQGLPFIIGSDSAGTYGTSAEQLGLAAYYSGLDAAGFEQLQAHQQYLMQHQIAHGDALAAGIDGWNTPEGKQAFVQTLIEALQQVPTAPVETTEPVSQSAIDACLQQQGVRRVYPGEPVAELAGKRAVVIVGASGESWKRIPPGQQRENAIAIDMLLHALGDGCYIVQGRHKKTGLSKVLYESLKNANETREQRGESPLYSMGLYVSPGFDMALSYRHLTHMEHQQGQLLDLADALVDHTFAHEGVLVAVGGAAFTRDIILKADQRGIRAPLQGNRKMMLLLANTDGASAEKAAVLHPDYKAMDGRQLIKKLYEQQPTLFPDGFQLSALNALYIASSRRVVHFGYNLAGSSEVHGLKQIVATYQPVSPKP